MAGEETRPRAPAWRLARAPSAYLRGAAEQPIEWHPWGPEAFETARRLHRPLLLDIGAVWCHWCHVMDEGTYADEEVARLIRQGFIAVKVDRDEHPEVDRRYQRQVNALTGEGGWPLTAFLLPTGEVFLGGTYFPPQDGLGRPGFRRVLKEVSRLFREEPEKVQANAQAVREALGRIDGRRDGATPRPSTAFVSSTLSHVLRSYDPVHGGFGMAPKFPHPSGVEFLLFAAYAAGDASLGQKARTTLLRMAEGGVYDQLAGGFHRYATDEGWHIPHFEKMGSDNAALLAAFADGARAFPDPALVEATEGIATWSDAVLGDPDGGWGASQDADNAPGDDGGYFTWSRAQLKALLSADELRLATRILGVGADGRMPHDPEQNVLYRLMEPADAGKDLGLEAAEATDRWTSIRSRLLAARSGRAAPFVDRALYADINGSFIVGYVRAATLLGRPAWLHRAQAAADRFLSGGFDPRRGVAHRLSAEGAGGFGHLQDQGEFARGLVELAGATLDRRYVEAAQAICGLAPLFASESGILRDLAPTLYDGPSVAGLGEATYPVEDNPNLSGNAAMALAMLRLSSLTSDDAWRERAATLLAAVRPKIEGAGLFGAGTAWATGLVDLPPARVIVEGNGREAMELRAVADRSPHPNLWAFSGVPPSPFALPEELAAAADRKGPARALVCFGTRCLAPITEPAALRDALAAAPERPG